MRKALACLTAVAAALAASVWWLDFSDEPVKADLLVVLGGADYGRPYYAAELFAQGYAPEVWLSRQRMRPSLKLAREAGAVIPSEEEAFREVLLKKGVPAAKIHPYGEDAASTLDEARALAAAVGPGKKILAVTSRFHARRARLILRGALKRDSVIVVATPYEPFRRLWWRDKSTAGPALLEFFKTVYFLLGGGSKDPGRPRP